MLKAAIVGDRETVERFKRMPGNVRDELRKTVESLSQRLQVKVKADKLSGQVLKVRTGRLRRSINYRIAQEGAGIYGYVGTNLSYGRAWELGFQGTVQVGAFQRKTKSGGVAMVMAHSRRVNMQPRSFLRTALAEMTQTIKDEIRGAAIKAATKR
jgi:hypothetical protein